MAAIPAIPAFTAGDSSLLHLQQIASAVSFLVDLDTRPTWKFIRTTTASIAATTWTTVAYGTAVYDNDGVYTTGGIATIVTAGYYAVEHCWNFESGTASNSAEGRFLVTVGSGNPSYTSGTTFTFGHRSVVMHASSSQDAGGVCADQVPIALYPGDTIAAQVYATAALTLNYLQNTSYIYGRMTCAFTGHYLRPVALSTNAPVDLTDEAGSNLLDEAGNALITEG